MAQGNLEWRLLVFIVIAVPLNVLIGLIGHRWIPRLRPHMRWIAPFVGACFGLFGGLFFELPWPLILVVALSCAMMNLQGYRVVRRYGEEAA